MKLFELFTTATKHRDVQDLRAKDKPANRVSGDRDYGAFARVKDTKNDPHTVNKIAYKAVDNLSNDAYYCYIRAIVDNKIAQENPYAPRIYKINEFDGSDGSQKYTVNMEKLIKGTDIGYDEIKQYGDRLFPLNSPDEPDGHRVVDQQSLAGCINDVFHRPSTDPKLDELMHFIKDIRDKAWTEGRKFSWDLHGFNIMFRRSLTGIQVVITDPLSQA